MLHPSLTPNVFPISSAYELPFLFTSARQAVYAYTKLLENNPDAAREYGDFKILAFTGSVPMDLVSVTPIRSLADLRGKRVGVMQAQAVEIARLLGMSPVLLTLSDFYLSLQRGIIDCSLAALPTYRSTKVCEVGKYIVRLRVSMTAAPTVMNSKVYEGLPADVRAVIDRYTPDAFNIMGCNVIEGSAMRDLQWLKDNNGVEEIELPAEDVARLRELVAPAYAAWEDTARKYGVQDPAAILAQLRGYAEEYRSAEVVREFESRYLPLLGDMYKQF